MNSPKIARRADISPFIVMDVMARANEKEASGENIIHMEVGQPATRAPQKVIDAAHRALDEDRLGYTEATGLPVLRARISAHYQQRYGLDVPDRRIIVTTGSSAGFVLAFLALFDKGDKVALPVPGYPCYPHILRALDIHPLMVRTDNRTRWCLDVDHLDGLERQGHEISGVLVASPNNPTGVIMEDHRLQALAGFCDHSGIPLICDEIYHGLSYQRHPESALAFGKNVIVINSFSKYFSMTGWRIGWMVVPEKLVRPVERLQQNLYINAPTLSQLAAVSAFDCMDELEGYRRAYEQNRNFLLRELPEIGFDKILPADGAFYLYADVSRFTDDSRKFTRQLLEETGVALTPGNDFDAEYGHHFLRFSYARSHADMQEAVKRLKAWMRRQ